MRCNSATAPRAMFGERMAAMLLQALLRVMLKPILSPYVPIRWQRAWTSLLSRLIRRRGFAQIRAGAVGGINGEWVRAGHPSPGGEAVILYLHGGACCIGSPATHRAVTSHLARAAGLDVFAADYRLAPEHPFPAAMQDCLAAYRALRTMGPVVIAGDSAGAGLAVATTLAARQQQISAPAALVLFSPWVDLSLSGECAAGNDPLLSARWLSMCAAHYLAGADAKSPLASPLYGDLHGFPPTFIQAAADELLLPDSEKIRDALRKAGAAVNYDVVQSCWHGFQLFADMLPSADAAIARAGRFIALSVLEARHGAGMQTR
jgi:acetyl esterase/lipase